MYESVGVFVIRALLEAGMIAIDCSQGIKSLKNQAVLKMEVCCARASTS